MQENLQEKYNTLKLTELREIVRAAGVKHTSAMRKPQLVEILCRLETEKSEGNRGTDSTSAENSLTEKQFGADTEREREEDGGQTEIYGRSAESREMAENRERSAESREWTENRERGTDSRERTENRERSADSREMAENRERSTDSRERAENRERGTDSRERAERRDRSEPRERSTENRNTDTRNFENNKVMEELDSGQIANGILEVMSDGFGFIRCENYLPGDNDVYVSPAQIRRFNLKTGDIVEGNLKIKTPTEKFSALLYVRRVNGLPPSEAVRRSNFEDMTPIFPNERIRLESERSSVPMRIVDIVSPIGKGQRGMIVSPPKTGKTTLLKQMAKAIHKNHPDMNMIILLIDERPEEVTDIKEYIEGENVEVIYSTFDELPDHHKRVSEMVLERAKRLVEHKKDVIILLDSITRLARAYNLTVPPSGRTLSGGLDPAALHMPKKFFGAARNMREGGSLTVLATALVETGSKMDDVVFEEFKGTGNMELVLDRRLSEKRIFPAVDIARSGTRRDELLLDRDEQEACYLMRKALNGMKSEEALEHIIEMFMRTRNNRDFIANIKRTKII